MKKEKNEKVKLNLDELEIESFETKMAPVVTGGASGGFWSCRNSSCVGGGPC